MNDELYQTGLNMRKSAGLTAIALPILLPLLAGWQDSISAYYWTSSGRDALVGALALISGFMMAYASADWRSRYAARTAAVSALVVGWFPTAPANPTSAEQWMGALHGLGALVFFGSLAYQAWQLFPRGASPAMGWFYKACAVVIVLGIVVSAGGILIGAPGRYVFWWEAVSIWAFGLAWFAVGRDKVPG